VFNSNKASGVEMEERCSREEPAESFLEHVEERLGLNEDVATARLGSWLLSYEPGPLALARAGVRIEQNGRKQRLAA
jgi:hypothetical protein